MTRRTPNPGDAFSGGGWTWRIVSVDPDFVTCELVGPWGHGLVAYTHDMFHREIESVTWGKR